MIDYARITVKAGDGGSGCGSFHRIKGKRWGKADGGDGGRGGNVYVEATGDLNTLEPYRYVKEYKAKNGEGGLSRLRRGAEGEDLMLKVPVGTVIKILDDRSKMIDGANPKSTIYDLTSNNQKVLVARGGEGGRGNSHLRDEFGRRPRVGEKGETGEAYGITLELKLIADVGLIGQPNAGKSTLLSKLSAARPKIAPYPFTTLEPNLGVMKRLVIADIPGLIEGASRGRGLGDLFLRHIERTKVLVHLIDVSKVTKESEESEVLWKDYQTITNELRNYSKELAKKKEIVVLTKADLVSDGIMNAAREEFKKHRKKVLAISAVSGKDLEELVKELLKSTSL